MSAAILTLPSWRLPGFRLKIFIKTRVRWFPGHEPASLMVMAFYRGNGSVVADHATIDDYYSACNEYLHRAISDGGLRPATYLPRRGDLQVWHGALIHGGSPIINTALARKSYVCHYTNLASHPQLKRFRHQQGFGFDLFQESSPGS